MMRAYSAPRDEAPLNSRPSRAGGFDARMRAMMLPLLLALLGQAVAPPPARDTLGFNDPPTEDRKSVV